MNNTPSPPSKKPRRQTPSPSPSPNVRFEERAMEMRLRQQEKDMEKSKARNKKLADKLASLPDIPSESGKIDLDSMMKSMGRRNRSPSPPPTGMKTGGLVKKTGVYTLHKGEVVVPAARVKSVDMSLKKDKKSPLKK
jgi:hypothetical protein